MEKIAMLLNKESLELFVVIVLLAMRLPSIAEYLCYSLITCVYLIMYALGRPCPPVKINKLCLNGRQKKRKKAEKQLEVNDNPGEANQKKGEFDGGIPNPSSNLMKNKKCFSLFKTLRTHIKRDRK